MSAVLHFLSVGSRTGQRLNICTAPVVVWVPWTTSDLNSGMTQSSKTLTLAPKTTTKFIQGNDVFTCVHSDNEVFYSDSFSLWSLLKVLLNLMLCRNKFQWHSEYGFFLNKRICVLPHNTIRLWPYLGDAKAVG